MPYTDSLETWFRQVSRSMLGEYETLIATFALAQSVIARGVPGDFAECGVYSGAECAAMAKALQLSGQTSRRVHLFDSFQGCPTAGPEDVEFIQAGVQPGGAACPEAHVRRNMSDWGIPEELLVWHPGWFADTMPGCKIESIALLRLDCDLYESMQPCLKYLWPKVPTGGWVIVDDYPLSGCRKALQEVIYPQPIYFQQVIPIERRS